MTDNKDPSIKALVIGDPHFKKSNVKDSDDFVKASLKVAAKHKFDFIVVLGDVLDTHESSNQKPQQQAIEWLLNLSKIGPLYILIGNHDRPNNSTYLTNEHFFTALKEWKNTYVIDKPYIAKIKGKIFTFMPYVPNGRFRDALKTLSDGLEWDKSRCIFAHQEFKGVKMGYVTSVNGDKWTLSEPLIITGHIHEYSKPQSNIIYVGTPRQNAFDESPDKAITLFTFDDSLVEERIDLGLRKKREIEITVDELESKELPGDYDLKITIVGKISEIRTVKKLSLVKEWKQKGHKIVYKDLPDNEEKINISIGKTTSFAQLLYDKCKDSELREDYELIFGKPIEKKKVRVRIDT